MLEYEQGYFKALMDLGNFCDIYSEDLKTLRAKKYVVLLGLIKYLVENEQERELFAKYGGNVGVKISNVKKSKDVKILSVFDRFNHVSEVHNK